MEVKQINAGGSTIYLTLFWTVVGWAREIGKDYKDLTVCLHPAQEVSYKDMLACVGIELDEKLKVPAEMFEAACEDILDLFKRRVIKLELPKDIIVFTIDGGLIEFARISSLSIPWGFNNA